MHFSNTQEQDAQQILLHLERMRHLAAPNKADGDGAYAVLSAEEKRNYVKEILDKWAPLAEELGMSKEQHELEELSIKVAYPDDYKKLKKLLQESEATCEIVFKTFALPIHAMLKDLGIEYEFKYRMKSVYSIWRKMNIDHKEFDDVYDLFATRIIYKPKDDIDELANENAIDVIPEVKAVKEWQKKTLDAEKFYCWRIYTVISSLYRIHPDRIRDWITKPKPSGYQALQLTVMGPDCNWIEIQVRSERMDYDAEQGVAAHWKYKQESAGNLNL